MRRDINILGKSAFLALGMCREGRYYSAPSEPAQPAGSRCAARSNTYSGVSMSSFNRTLVEQALRGWRDPHLDNDLLQPVADRESDFDSTNTRNARSL